MIKQGMWICYNKTSDLKLLKITTVDFKNKSAIP